MTDTATLTNDAKLLDVADSKANASACVKNINDKRSAASLVSDEGSGGSSDEDNVVSSVGESATKKLKLSEGDADDKKENSPEKRLDLSLTLKLLADIKKAGDQIKDKDVLLLIGETGAGKTTSALSLAGVRFECIDVDGLDHYEPVGVPDSMSDFKVSGSGTSVTKSIHAAAVPLRNGESVIICDTPGFGDTKGTEMKISNDLGIIHALQQARSIKMLVLLNAECMHSARYTPLRQSLKTVLNMMGSAIRDFSSFEYVFTRCEPKKAKKIHRQLAGFQRQVQENPQGMLGDEVCMKDTLIAMLSDMITKSQPVATVIDLDDDDEEEDEAPSLLESLWSNKARITNPEDVFQSSISTAAMDRLNGETSRLQSRMEDALKAGNLSVAKETLQQLQTLASALGLKLVKDTLRGAEAKALSCVSDARSNVDAISHEMIDEQSSSKFTRMAHKLRKALEAYYDIQSIQEIFEASSQNNTDEYGLYLVSIVSKVFTSFQKSIESIPKDASSISKSADALKQTLTMMQAFTKAFDGFFSDGLLQGEFDLLTESAASLIKFVVGTLHTDQEPTLKETKGLSGHLLFARSMLAFLDDTGIILACAAQLKKQVNSFVAEIKVMSNGTMSTLNDLISQMNDFGQWDDIEESAALLRNVACDEVDDCRKFILAMLEMEDFLQAVHGNDESLQSFESVLTNFDAALNEWMTSAVERLCLGGQQVVDDSKEASMAQSLVEAITVAQTCGNIVANWPVFDGTWGSENMIQTKTRLEQYIEEMADLEGPESLLYGPEELGEEFYDKLVLLRAYKVEHGTCNVKRKHNYSLERWTSSLRKEIQKRKQGLKSNLTDKQVRALKKLGFDFRELKDQLWWTKLEELKSFKSEHGHCKVPLKYSNLGAWVNNQRAAMSAKQRGIDNKHKMPADRENALSEIGFVWDAR